MVGIIGGGREVASVSLSSMRPSPWVYCGIEYNLVQYSLPPFLALFCTCACVHQAASQAYVVRGRCS